MQYLIILLRNFTTFLLHFSSSAEKIPFKKVSKSFSGICSIWLPRVQLFDKMEAAIVDPILE